MGGGMVYYGKPNLISSGTNADIDTTEEDIVSGVEVGDLVSSQLTLFAEIGLGTHTALDLRIYCRHSIGGTWYQLLKRDIETGLLEEDIWRFDASTPANSVIDLPISSCQAVKITGKGVGGANGTATVRLMGRNN